MARGVHTPRPAALRVLRGLEEEGEKSRAASVSVKVSSEVALYILNQKRGELTRIENEHAMAISFDPKDGMAAGSFEIERVKSRDPGERPRAHAVGIEAGFVPSSEPEPEYEEEVEEDEPEAEEAEWWDSHPEVAAEIMKRAIKSGKARWPVPLKTVTMRLPVPDLKAAEHDNEMLELDEKFGAMLQELNKSIPLEVPRDATIH